MDQRLHEIPFGLWTAGIVAAVLGVSLLGWLLWHALRGLVDQPRVPRSRATYGFYSMLCLLLLAGAGLTFGLGRLLRDHARVDLEGNTRVAQVRCHKTAGGKVRLTYAGARAPAAATAVESAGPSCELSAEVITMRPWLARVGLGTLVRVSRIGDVPRAPENPPWLVPEAGAPTPLPLGLLVRDARASTLSVAPDDAAVFHLIATPAGLALERSGG